MKSRTDTDTTPDALSEAWEAYLAEYEKAATKVSQGIRCFVEEDILADGRPRYAKAFAVESSDTKAHRGSRRRPVSRGLPAVKQAGAEHVVDLRHYFWNQVVYEEEDGGSLTPIIDIAFIVPHRDMRSSNRHVALNGIVVTAPGCDALDDPTGDSHYIGELRENTDTSVVENLEKEIDLAIQGFCRKRGVDPRSGQCLLTAK